MAKKTISPFESSYKRLNKAQKKAVDTIDGPLLVVAGPGSGKTEILSLRVANILRLTDIPASGILCLTFTDSAAVNMRKRLVEIIGIDAYRVGIYTFHSFALSVIERFPEHFYKGVAVEPADKLVQSEILESIFNKMDHKNPLRSEHPEKGYVYMSSVKESISALKKAGLTPEEFQSALDVNKSDIESINREIDRVFGKTLRKDSIEEALNLADRLEKLSKKSTFPVPHFKPLSHSLALSVRAYAQEALEEDSTKPLSNWKQRHTQKDGSGRVLKKDYWGEKLAALADVYQEYQEELLRRGHVDFDDMLLEVVKAIEESSLLRSELQERYLYFLIDEFQDTNDAQMRLLGLLTEAEVHEGNPNIMAVGDDDQAIYRFQGAEISNILRFTENYSTAQVITMTENYRSTQDVLNIAREVIVQGEERLERLLPDIKKNLVAKGEHKEGGEMKYEQYRTRFDEYEGVARSISQRLEEGEVAQNIAVIARRHHDLESLVPYLYKYEIPVTYERQLNVLEESHIRQLVRMAQFISTLARKDREEADYFLPEILSYPFWGLSRADIWHISLATRASDPKSDKLWLEVMLESENEKIVDIAEFFLDLAIRSKSEPMEYILEALVGSHVPLVPENDEDEGDTKTRAREFVSPYKQYYFSRERFDNKREEYIRFLSCLQTFVGALREHNAGKIVTLDDAVRFVELHEKNNIPLNDVSLFTNAQDAVSLLSAHKAKGLEFDTVYILSAVQEVWAARPRNKLITFPPNLPITPPQDTLDDQLRLFYVALTRARSHLYISGHAIKDDGKEVLPLAFISNVTGLASSQATESDTEEVLAPVVPRYHTPPFVRDENAILKNLVDDYQLSVTHLNNFLDVTQGGPQIFLEHNLLRFPQPMTINAVFGSVMHRVLERFHRELAKNGGTPHIKTALSLLKEELLHVRISQKDCERLMVRGKESLEALCRERKDGFSPQNVIEYNFKREGAVVGGVPLTGKIDKMEPVGEKEMIVCDYKTGAAFRKWDKSSVKLWRYRNQLIFYKLLVENSREFGGKKVVKKGILEFIEPDEGEIVSLVSDITKEDTDRMSQVVEKVYKKIQNLDFPDTSGYASSLKGNERFIEDLLSNTI